MPVTNATKNWPTGSTAERLAWSRQQLLDLTTRNRLLSFAPGAPGFKDRDARVYKHLPVLADLDVVWKRLVDDEKPVRIIGNEHGEQDGQCRELIAGGSLIAVFEEEALEKRLLKLFRERTTLEQLTGDSAFFLALGFLEWQDAPEGKSHFAPLLLIHVELVRPKSAGGGLRTYSVEIDTNELRGNPCLREKLRQEHFLDLPPADSVISPEAYLKTVEAAVGKKSKWRVHRTAALGFFNFTRYRLWLDLDPSEWPEGASPADHPLVKDLIDQKWNDDDKALPDDYEVAEHQVENDLPVVLDADSTQYAALLAATRGKSLVIVGPPGSGKSQTITNLIATTIAEGKRVLFVAQKLAALEVVQRRLTEVGLSPFCLPLHSHHSKPSDVHKQLRLAGSARMSTGGAPTGGSGIAHIARSLNALAESLRTPPAGLSSSVASLLQRGCVLRAQAKEAWGQRWDEGLLELDIPRTELSDAWFDERTRCLSEWARLRKEAQNHWKGWQPTNLRVPDLTRFEDALRKLQGSIQSALPCIQALPAAPISLPVVDLATILNELLRNRLPERLQHGLLTYAYRCADSDIADLHELERLLDDHQRLLAHATSTLIRPDGPAIELAREVTAATALVAAWIRPHSRLSMAQSLLDELASAIGKIDDLLADSARFPGGIGLLGATDVHAPTWECVQKLASLKISEGIDQRPVLHNPLARALAQGRINQQEVRDLTRKVDRVREVEAFGETNLPGIGFSTPQDRQRWLRAATKMLSHGLSRFPVKNAEEIRKSARRLLSTTNDLVDAHQQPSGTTCRLLPELTGTACKRLVERTKEWRAELLSPPDTIADELLCRMTQALADGKIALASLSVAANTVETARALALQVNSVFTAVLAGVEEVHLPSTITSTAMAYCSAGGKSATTSELGVLQKTGEQIARFIELNKPFLASIARVFDLPPPETLADVRRLATLSEHLTKMPALPESGIASHIASKEDVSRLRTAMTRAADLTTAQVELSKRHTPGTSPDRKVVVAVLERIKRNHRRLLKWFSSEYRSARRIAANLLSPPVPRDNALISQLTEVEEHLRRIEEFSADAELIRLTAGAFKGLETEWSGIASVLDWAEQFYQLSSQRLSLARLSDIKLKAGSRIAATSRVYEQIVRALTDWCTKHSWAIMDDRSRTHHEIKAQDAKLTTVEAFLLSISEEASSVVASMEKLGCPPRLTLAQVAEATNRSSELSRELESLAHIQSLVPTALLRFEPQHLRLLVDWCERGRQCQLTVDDLLCLASGRQSAVENMLTTKQLVTEWVLSAQSMFEFMPDGQWISGESIAAAEKRIADFLEELDDLTCDLPSVSTDTFTFKGLNDLLCDFQSCDAERTTSSSWDELLQERLYDSDTELLRRTAEWTKRASVGLPGVLLDWCLEHQTDARLHWLKSCVIRAMQLRQSIDLVTHAGVIKREEVGLASKLTDAREVFSSRRALLGANVETLARRALNADSTIETLSQAGAALAHSCNLAGEIGSWDTDIGVQAISLDAVQVAEHRKWALTSKSWDSAFARWILEDPAYRYTTINSALRLVEIVLSSRKELLERMRESGPIHGNGPAGIARELASIAELDVSASRMQIAVPKLLSWADCLRENAKARRLGLGKLLDTYGEDDSTPNYEELLAAFRAAVAVQQATFAWESDEHLSAFRGIVHDRLRQEFAEADGSLLVRNRLRVANAVLDRVRKLEFGNGRVATPQMYQLLKHEEQKLRKHVSVRELVKRAGPALQEFCPCWLMTPMAVAQFLPPGKIEFDLIIMDEASQLAPEDAWGAIARGRQLVVVGDPKQMPPTDFFTTNVGEDEDEQLQDEMPSGVKLDSILDTASNCLPQSWLQWHYRSRHQSLIAPANRFSYGDRLVLFPSAHDRNPALGIRYTYIPGAKATTGRVVNTAEAGAIVDRLIQIALEEYNKDPDDRMSVGVVAMNAAQQECIQELLDARTAAHAGTEKAIACLYENQNEPLIVRNLENIQGDERDIILISYTYGPNTVGGTPAQRFGPLNYEGGERRFNVLITRSKSRMEVFSSIRSEQIQVTGKKLGVQHFHYFLKYTECGTLVDPGDISSRTADSPFEEHVMAVLRADGYEVQPQVGVAGYFIDIAVRDPRDPSRFILGVECDGATYHSSRAARDRDRLREGVLRDRGWRLYRIWSTDWFTNYEAAKESLLVNVARVCEGYPCDAV